MSTKTTFKRVALVAAVAAAFGGLSTVAANAGNPPTLNSATAGANTTSSFTTGTYNPETITAGTSDNLYTITTAGVGSVYYPSSAPSTPSATTLSANSATSEVWSNGAGAIGAGAPFAATNLLVSVYSATAGTQTITVTGSSSAAQTITITWAAAPTISAANSSVLATNLTHIRAGTVETVTADTLSAVVKDAVVPTSHTTAAAAFWVNLKNNATPAAGYTADVIGASVSGPGLLKVGVSDANGALSVADGASAGRSVVAATAGQYGLVELFADGTSGTSTVTITDATAGITIATVSVTFYSSTIASLKATTQYNVPLAAVTNFTAKATEGFTGAAGTASVGAPVYVTAADANGNAIPNSVSSISVTSSATTVATVATYPNWDATNSYYYPVITPVSEGKTTLTFTDVSTGLVVATTSVLVTKAVVAAITASTDASSYQPGTKVVYTITATDADGNPVADGAYSDFFNAAYPTSNVGLQGSLPAANSVSFVGGVNSSTLYAPLSTAAVTIAGGTIGSGADVATALQASTLPTASFATTGSADTQASAATDAANEATDAANAATDAANAAADAADAATAAAQDASAQAQAALAAVNALSAKITVLAAQIAKIIKKLGA
jgi:hypothetical protein